MITNFEEISEDLTELELKFSDEIEKIIYSCFCERIETTYGRIAYSKPKKVPIKQAKLCDMVNNSLIEKHGLFVEIKLTSVRLRKYFNFFRSNSRLPLIATSDGCYISDDKAEIEKQILSMEQRARQILKASEGMKKFLI